MNGRRLIHCYLLCTEAYNVCLDIWGNYGYKKVKEFNIIQQNFQHYRIEIIIIIISSGKAQ